MNKNNPAEESQALSPPSARKVLADQRQPSLSDLTLNRETAHQQFWYHNEASENEQRKTYSNKAQNEEKLSDVETRNKKVMNAKIEQSDQDEYFHTVQKISQSSLASLK